MTGRADYYAEGDWNAICFECGRKRKASQLKKHWKGYYVCPEHWEPREAQDFVRSVIDVQTPPWAQPMPADTFGQARLSNGAITTTSTIYVDIPWNPAGSIITDFVLTNYVTAPISGVPSVRIVIPEGTTITGSFSFGSGWPVGTEFIVSNSGSVTVTPTWSSSTNVTVNGVPYGTSITNPTYTVQWNLGAFASSTWILIAASSGSGGFGFSKSSFGSILPTQYLGNDIQLFSTDTTPQTVLFIAGSQAQDLFALITVNSITLTSAAATYIAGGPFTSWAWAGVTIFPGVGTYSIVII